MKCRGIVVIDYDIDGGFLEAAEEQKKLEEVEQDSRSTSLATW